MIYTISAVHLEFSLVIIVGQDASVAIQIDVVARLGIHEHLHGGLWRDVQIEVEVHVTLGGFLHLGLFLLLVGEAVSVRHVGDEVGVGHCDGRRGVIHQGGSALWSALHIDVHLSWLPVDMGCARGIYRAAEVEVLHLREVVSQDVVGLYLDVIGHVLEVMMGEFALDACCMLGSALAAQVVIDSGSGEADGVGDEYDAVACQMIIYSQRGDAHRSLFGNRLSLQVDGLEGTIYVA